MFKCLKMMRLVLMIMRKDGMNPMYFIVEIQEEFMMTLDSLIQRSLGCMFHGT